MDSKIVVAAAAVAVFGIWLFKRKNDAQNDNRRQNRETDDLNDPDSLLAVKFKRCLEWEKGIMGYGGPVIKDKFNSATGQAELYNLCLQVTDWSKLQKKFSLLCDNESTILQAFQSMLTDTEVYNTALELCKAKKVISTTAATATLLEDNNEPNALNIAANTILGAYTLTYNGMYNFINGFASNGAFFSPTLIRTTGRISIDNAKLI